MSSVQTSVARLSVCLLLLPIIFAGCTSAIIGSKETELRERYEHIRKMHFSGVEQYYQHTMGLRKCFSERLELVRGVIEGTLQLTSAEIEQQENKCLEKLPQIPKDRQSNETFEQYSERKLDEWEEKDCFWQYGRLVGSIERRELLEKQCLRDLELKRIRKVLQKLSPQ